jgi:hypothetical protein
MAAVQYARSVRALALTAVAASALIGVMSSPGSAHAAGAGASRHCAAPVATTTRMGKFGGIQRPQRRLACGTATARAQVRGTEPPYEPKSAPPLLYGPGSTAPVMATDPGTALTITPIFWQGTSQQGYRFSTSYKALITRYISDVAAASVSQNNRGNLYATLTQYYMNTAQGEAPINDNFAVGPAVVATNKIPKTCTVNGGKIYSDGSKYTSCVADADVAIEVKAVLAAKGLSADLNHLYPIIFPKHVEVCFSRNNPGNQQCTVNNSPSAAFCAYHSFAKTGAHAIYAAMPFPIYHSTTGYTCSSEFDAPGNQFPNANPDGDVLVSSLSHEMSEAITDPRLNAWSAIDGNENGDLCSSEYGAFTGPPGRKWNQTINSHHYLTQEEFSNKEFARGKGGCVQDENVPTVTSVSRSGNTVTVHGTGLRPGKTRVQFGGLPAVGLVTVAGTTSLTLPAPAPLGVADLTVTTPNGTSATSGHDVYADRAPTVSSISPADGPSAGGTTVTIDGAEFAPYTDVSKVFFGTARAQVVSATGTELIVTAPPHTGTGPVDVTVGTSGGTSAPQTYTYDG